MTEQEIQALRQRARAAEAEAAWAARAAAAAAKQERDNWQRTAEQEFRNMQYYRGLIVQIGEHFGIAAKTQDDGGIVEDVLCAKVPELVVAVKQERDALAAALEVAAKYVPGTDSLYEDCETHNLEECTCQFCSAYRDAQIVEDAADPAILATVRAEARAEGMRLLLREFSHWTPWGTREAVCERIRAMMTGA